MDGFLLFIFITAMVWGGAYFRAPFILWAPACAFVLFVLTWLQWLGGFSYFVWPVFLLLLAVTGVPFIRQRLTKPLFGWFIRVLPSMSNTEKEAIEAGDVGWEKALFQGKPHWQDLMNLPVSHLSPSEQAFLDTQVETLCSLLNDWEIVQNKSDLSQEAWEFLKKEKFFGMIIPKAYGGLGFSPLAHSAVITKLGTRSISAAVTAMVPNSLGPAELLLLYGTQAQKNYYLPRLADGTEVPCFALTSPDAGSDAGALQDTGVVCKENVDGKEILGIRLTFNKRYITLAPVATVLGLAFKLIDPNKLLSNEVDRGITLCLVDTKTKGIECHHRHFPLNMAFMNGPVRGQDVFVPLDTIIGGPQNIGQGWRMLMECLSAGRGISLPALSTATGMLSYRMTGAYSMIRRQFNVSLSEFEGVEEALARIAGYTYMLEATRQFTASAISQGKKPSVATAIAKYHMTETSRKVMNDAMDIHAGKGIMLGPMNYLARGYQSIPVSITVEGANILTRSLMIFGQGAIRCHPYVYNEIKAAQLYQTDKSKALKSFDKNVIGHVGYLFSNLVRVLTLSLTRGVFSALSYGGELRPYMKKLNWLSASFALSTDIAMMTLGGSLKRKERISARFGDILSHLYIASAIIKHYHEEGRPLAQWPMVQWGLQYSCYQAQEAFYGLFQNFPIPGIRFLLKLLTFPYGKAFVYPSDDLGHAVVQPMLTNSEVREKLTSLCFVGKTLDDPTGAVEITFRQLMEVQPSLKKIQQAIKEKKIDKSKSFEKRVQSALEQKLISTDEKEALLYYEVSRQKVIAVDEFTSEFALGSDKKWKSEQNPLQAG